jgi:hypothetical protein
LTKVQANKTNGKKGRKEKTEEHIDNDADETDADYYKKEIGKDPDAGK